MIRDNLNRIRATMDQAACRAGRDVSTIKLVAVSKYVDPQRIQEAMDCGQLLFGENYLQEAAEKKPKVDSSTRWHFIGHLQSNKARQAVALFDMIETVDRLKIAKALDQQAKELSKELSVLVQVNIGREPQKSGVLPKDTQALLMDIQRHTTNLLVQGLMAMPPFSDNPEDSRPYFKELVILAKQLASAGLFQDNEHVELSMGMSTDFAVAIEEGATIIRVGTALFGERI